MLILDLLMLHALGKLLSLLNGLLRFYSEIIKIHIDIFLITVFQILNQITKRTK